VRRNKIVFLIGKVVEHRFEEMEIKDLKELVAYLTVATDLKAFGGHHRVMVIGRRKVAEVKAAVQVNGGEPPEVAVQGYLAGGMVVAERVIFLVNSEARAWLARMVQEMELRREVAFGINCGIMRAQCSIVKKPCGKIEVFCWAGNSLSSRTHSFLMVG